MNAVSNNNSHNAKDNNSPAFLLLEDGGKIALESNTGYILLENQPPPTPSTWYGTLSNPLTSPLVSPVFTALL